MFCADCFNTLDGCCLANRHEMLLRIMQVNTHRINVRKTSIQNFINNAVNDINLQERLIVF